MSHYDSERFKDLLQDWNSSETSWRVNAGHRHVPDLPPIHSAIFQKADRWVIFKLLPNSEAGCQPPKISETQKQKLPHHHLWLTASSWLDRTKLDCVCVLKQQHWHIRVSTASGRDFFKHVTVTLLKCHFFLFFLSFFFAFYDFPRLWNSHWFTVNLKWFLFLSPGRCSFLTLTFKDGGHGNTFSSSMCPFMVARQIR